MAQPTTHLSAQTSFLFSSPPIPLYFLDPIVRKKSQVAPDADERKERHHKADVNAYMQQQPND